MVQELVKKSSHSSPEASFDTETGETDASAIARVQTDPPAFGPAEAVARALRIGSRRYNCDSRSRGQLKRCSNFSEFRPQEAA